MISAGMIYDYINSIAPFDTAMGFDNVGILVGSRSAESERVLLALDVTGDVINEAAALGAGIILTHHPVIFSPLKRLDTDSSAYRLAASGITVISAHTNLDIATGGVNDTLAQALGISSEEGTDGECMLVGSLSGEISADELALEIKNKLGCAGLRYWRRRGSIRTVAVACGAGGSSIFAAAQRGADALITGEIKHHEIIFAHENNIAVFDAGHFRSEDLIIEKLASMLGSQFPDTEFIKAESDTDHAVYI